MLQALSMGSRRSGIIEIRGWKKGGDKGSGAGYGAVTCSMSRRLEGKPMGVGIQVCSERLI